MDHGRLHWYEPEELDEQQRKIYDAVVGGPRSQTQVFERTDEAGRLYGPFNAMLVDPVVGDALQAVGAALRFQTSFAARTREVAILEVAAYRESEYEWYAHRQIALSLGMTEAEVDAIKAGERPSTFSDDELFVQGLAHTLVTERDLPDDLYEEAVKRLGLPLVVDLIYLVGYYEALSLAMKVFRVDLPPGFSPEF